MRTRPHALATAVALGTFVLGLLPTGSAPASTAARPELGSPTECGTYSGSGCAPSSKRVDLAQPTFSRPTRITNPLFPISRLRSVVLLGRVEGKPFRSETTLLPETQIVRWNGRRIRVLVSEYLALLDGRIDEVALDRYAQADDGSVWYLGEDVFDYRNGTVAATEGTWLAGRDGPAAMIMPGRPRVGDVFRTENIPGVVFEEVTVKEVGKTVPGPRGPVAGALVGSELHLDGSRSDKIFAPGYGEFFTASNGELEALALAVPTDRVGGPVPPELGFLTTGAFGILESSRVRDWEAAASTAARLRRARTALAASAPPLIASRLDAKLNALGRAVAHRRPGAVGELAVDAARLALDLELRFRPAVEVDVERFHLWTQQLRVHAASGDRGGVLGDVAALEWLRDRVTPALDRSERRRLDTGLHELRVAAGSGGLASAADLAARLGAELRRMAST